MESIDITPTLLDVAGAAKPTKMQGRILFGDRAEPARDVAFGARDRCDETVFRFRTVRDARYRYIRNFTPERPFLQANDYKERQYPVWSLIKELGAAGKLTDWQKNFYLSPTMAPEELYDMNTDPWAMTNLVNSQDPVHQTTLVRLRGTLEKWITESDDQGRVLESAALVAAKGATKPAAGANAAKQKKTKKAN
jgi:arylsulfatase A-like enzyme